MCVALALLQMTAGVRVASQMNADCIRKCSVQMHHLSHFLDALCLVRAIPIVTQVPTAMREAVFKILTRAGCVMKTLTVPLDIVRTASAAIAAIAAATARTVLQNIPALLNVPNLLPARGPA